MFFSFLPIFIAASVVCRGAGVLANAHSHLGQHHHRRAPGVTCANGNKVRHQSCCIWFDVRTMMQDEMFSGDCGDVSHDALRLAFHDAIGYSSALKAQGKFPGGGADGSIMAFPEVESLFPGNKGVNNVVEQFRPFALRYPVSFGDFIQFAAAVGSANCVGGPRLKFQAGRPNAKAASPPDLLPDSGGTVESILARMKDAGFSYEELVDLLAAHSVGNQEDTNPHLGREPFDSTPSTFDSQFYLETLLKPQNRTINPVETNHGEGPSPYPGLFRIKSDYNIARHPKTACYWQSRITDHTNVVRRFELAMAKLAVLGQDVFSLVDCSEVVPAAKAGSTRVEMPAGKSIKDIDKSCPEIPFPVLPTASGTITSVLPVPTANDGDGGDVPDAPEDPNAPEAD